MSVLPCLSPTFDPGASFSGTDADDCRRLPSLTRPGAWLAGVLLGLGLVLGLATVDRALAQGQIQPVDLQCRLSGGPWLPCRMEVQDVGVNWVLRIGRERIEFRHGGDGAVTMQKGAGPWQPVTATWSPDTSLCWDGVCAKGDIPLD